MVAIRNWLVLCAALVKFSKAPESPIGGTPVIKHMQRELLSDSIEQLDARSPESIQTTHDQLNDGGSTGLKRKYPSSGSSRKTLRTNREEAASNSKHADNPENVEPLSEERKADIKRNLERYQEELTDMKHRGERMKTWFNILMQRDHMLGSYSYTDGGESIPSILKNLHGVQRDINWVIQTRFHEWAGLGQIAFEPVTQEDIAQVAPKLVDEHNDNFDSSLRVPIQHQTSSLIVTQEMKIRPAVETRTEKAQSVSEKAVSMNTSQATKKEEVFQKEAKPELRENILEIIYEKLMEAGFGDLSYILHTTNFQSWTNGNWLRSWEEIRVIKLAFEKSILQAIQFLYKFKLVEAEQFQGFLFCDQILDLIGDHLVDLFHVVQDFTFNGLAFVPDMKFLKNHWKTEHLHVIFSVLDNSQQARVLSTALTTTIQLYQFLVRRQSVAWSKTIWEIIIRDRFLTRLQEWTLREIAKDSLLTEENELKELGKKLVNLFQTPFPEFEQGGNLNAHERFARIQAGYILIYDILNFIKKYHKEYLRSLFDEVNQIEYDILKKQLKLFKTGFEVRQTIQQGKTYMDIIGFPSDGICMISKNDANENIGSTKESYDAVSERYMNLEKQFKATFQSNQRASHWFEGDISIARTILRSFHLVATSWQAGIEIEKRRREELRSLHRSRKEKETFSNLELVCGYQPSSQHSSASSNIELLDLWDPHGFYL